ncbi:MAG: hypothetical protein V1492_01225 [Candidatus Micrarchaeota archaeon]
MQLQAVRNTQTVRIPFPVRVARPLLEPLQKVASGTLSAAIVLPRNGKKQNVTPQQLGYAVKSLENAVGVQLILKVELPVNEFGVYDQLSPYVKAALTGSIIDIVVSMQAPAGWSYDSFRWRAAILDRMRSDGVAGLWLASAVTAPTFGLPFENEPAALNSKFLDYARFIFGATRVKQELPKPRLLPPLVELQLEKNEKLYVVQGQNCKILSAV